MVSTLSSKILSQQQWQFQVSLPASALNNTFLLFSSHQFLSRVTASVLSVVVCTGYFLHSMEFVLDFFNLEN